MATRKKRIWRTFFLFFSLSLLICTTLSAKDHLVLGLMGEPAEGFDPILGWGRYGNPLFQSTLLSRDDDLNITKDLARSYTVSADGKVWHVVLKKPVLFSDGTQLTAKDVAFTFNKAAATGGKADLSILDHAEVIDAQNVKFYLKKRDTTFIHRLITLGIVPEHIYKKGYGRAPLGSGPFIMKSWTEGEQMIAEINPYYYGEKPFFKKLVFLYGNEDTMFAAAKSGKVDMVVIPAHLGHQVIPGMKPVAVQSVDNRGLMFPCIPDKGVKSKTGAPIGNNVTSDPAIRKAINIGIHRKLLVEGVLAGFGRPAYFVCDGLPWDSPHNKIADNNKIAAEKILADAGWLDSDGDGIREKKGQKAVFNIIYPASRSVRQGLALAVADMLLPLGIKVSVEGKSWDGIKQRMHRDVIVFGWGSHNPMEIYHLYHSRLAGDGYYNAGFYKNARVDSYLDSAIGASSYEESLVYWKKAQFDGSTGCGPKGDVPWVWLVNLNHLYFISNHLDVGRLRIEPHGHGWPITANITQWRWSE